MNSRVKKLEYTKELIRCWVESWGVGNVYLAFSGGQDSTVLEDIVHELYPKIPLVFSNTGLEYPEIVKFVSTFDNLTIIKPKKTFRRVIKENGWPVVSKDVAMAINRYNVTKFPEQKDYRLNGKVVNGKKMTRGVIPKMWRYLLKAPFKISDACCDHLKKSPFKKFNKESGKKAMIGNRAQDSNIRFRDIANRGCNVYEAKHPQSRPLSYWTDKDINTYIKEKDISICSIYGMGYQHTGCMFCMFGLMQELKKTHTHRFLMMKTTHPKYYDYCINKLGGGEVLDFMKFPY